MQPKLPPCGLYRTVRTVAGVPAGRLVYFHNHGDPGAGVYLPTAWHSNRASFDPRGQTLEDPSEVSGLEPLPPEGLYRVATPFHCCEKQCRRFETDELLQLGYDASGSPIVFAPRLGDDGVTLPSAGTRIDLARTEAMRRLRVAEGAQAAERIVH